MIQDFEKDGCKFVIGEIEQEQGVHGQWCSKFEWDKDKKAFMLYTSTFIPAFGFPKTRQRIVDCFTYGTGFVYLREKQARREKWLDSPQYQEWIESRKVVNA
jgi:hypothetical protein